MVQTGPALVLIATTLVSMVLLYFATIKYVSDVLVGEQEEEHEGNTSSGGPTA